MQILFIETKTMQKINKTHSTEGDHKSMMLTQSRPPYFYTFIWHCIYSNAQNIDLASRLLNKAGKRYYIFCS